MREGDLTRRTGEVGRIEALRRQAIDDSHIGEDQYDYVDDSGAKIREITVPGPGGTTQTDEVDMSALFGTGVSTTGDVDLLQTEAELVADGVDLDNPHIPVNDQTLESALERCERHDLTPAWEVIDG